MKFVLRKRGEAATDHELIGIIEADAAVRILDKSAKMVLVDAEQHAVDNVIEKLGSRWFAAPLDTRYRPAD